MKQLPCCSKENYNNFLNVTNEDIKSDYNRVLLKFPVSKLQKMNDALETLIIIYTLETLLSLRFYMIFNIR